MYILCVAELVMPILESRHHGIRRFLAIRLAKVQIVSQEYLGEALVTNVSH